MIRRSILAFLLIPLALAACASSPTGGSAGEAPDGASGSGCDEINQFLASAPVAEADLSAAIGFTLPSGDKCISSRELDGTVSTFLYYLDGDQATFDAFVEAAPTGGWIHQGTPSNESAYFDFHTEGMLTDSDLPADLINDAIIVDYVTANGPSYLPAEYVQVEFTDAG